MIPLLLGSSLVLLATFIVRRFRRAGFVASNPHYQELLNRLNLHEIEDFLALPAVIISGHPDRHVARLTLGQGTEAQPAFLKREHRVRWRDRLASWWAGFGWSSKSSREALILQKLQQAGVPCANWIAFGEDHRGRAFLLLAGLSETIDLPQFLRDRREGFASPRRRFAAQLGVVLAQLHEAGFEHRDLYAKHVLVSSRTGEIFFLDWQRSRHSSPLRLNRRWHDLAALDATLAEDLVTPAERLLCLYSYLRTTDFNSRLPPRHLLSQAMTSICRASHRLLSKRHVRNERLCTHSLGSQGIPYVFESVEFVGKCKGLGTGCAFAPSETKRRVMPFENDLVTFSK